MIVPPALAGVQFKAAWILACAGMMERQFTRLPEDILDNISGTVHYVAVSDSEYTLTAFRPSFLALYNALSAAETRSSCATL